MTTNKKLRGSAPVVWLMVLTLAWVTGCSPSGPSSLLKGKRLMEQGKYAEAVEKLSNATRLMGTNAQAWNYLGLAYHQAGQPDNAAEAYRKALKFDRDLIVVHYNLGCLLLEQNKPADARNELTAFTLHEGSSVTGWLKLGTSELRLRDPAGAEKSFSEVLRLDAENPEAMNGLGLAELQRNHPREAVACFNRALVKQRDYAPALLNLAVVAHSYSADRQGALQKYRAYLALSPRPANWAAVNATAQQLEQELNQPGHSPTNAIVAVVSPATNLSRPASNSPLRGSGLAANPPRIEAPASTPHIAAVSPAKPVAEADAGVKPGVVRLPEPTAVKVAENVPPPSRPPPATATLPVSAPAASGQSSNPATTPDPEGRTFIQKINPVNIFRREPKPVAVSAAGANPALSTNSNVVSKTPPAQGTGPSLARYAYLSPPKPAAGNRAEAERLFAQAAQAQRNRRAKDAEELYRAAAKADPSFFEAQSNLGLAAYNLEDWNQSLPAYENALAVKPDSFSARFNFALALQKAGYLQDAAQELERLVAASPAGEPVGNLVTAHLTLAHLYASQFHLPASARPHFLKVLDLDPQNPEATSIRYWLQDNP